MNETAAGNISDPQGWLPWIKEVGYARTVWFLILLVTGVVLIAVAFQLGTIVKAITEWSTGNRELKSRTQSEKREIAMRSKTSRPENQDG